MRVARHILIRAVRPYIKHELPGWGLIYTVFIGDHRRDWLWSAAPIRTIRGKLHGYLMHLDLAKWADRTAYFLGRWYDLPTQLFISDLIRPGDTIVDVGANRGMFALLAARLTGDAGKVICFEPNPGCRLILDRDILSNQITNIVVQPFGLGSREEALILSVPTVNSGEGTFGTLPYHDLVTHHVRAQIRTGDEALSAERPTLIKIDVEGFEGEVVKGLVQTITRQRPILLVELIPSHLAACGSSAAELIGLLDRLQYRGFKLALKKAFPQHAWRLTLLDLETDAGCDSVWLHPATMESHHAALSGRISDYDLRLAFPELARSADDTVISALLVRPASCKRIGQPDTSSMLVCSTVRRQQPACTDHILSQ